METIFDPISRAVFSESLATQGMDLNTPTDHTCRWQRSPEQEIADTAGKEIVIQLHDKRSFH